MKRILIVGGGFAGVRVARQLRHLDDVRVTLISDEADFRYSPALYRTATGGRRRESSIALTELIDRLPNARFVQARAKVIDKAKRVLTTEDGQTYSYDFAVVALGVVTSYFGINGLETFSYSIKSAAEVERLKRHLHNHLVEANQTDKHYVVVGAGPTGVELSAALGHFLKRVARIHKIRRNRVVVELIEAADRVLPAMSPRASKLALKRLRSLGVKVRLKQAVKGATKTTLAVGQRTIPTQTVVWTAGVTNNPFFKANPSQFNLDPKGKVVVDGRLRVDDHLYVIGDNAAVQYSGLALTAIWQANYVAYSIRQQLLYGELPDDFVPNQPIYAVPIGHRRAVIQWRGISFDGWPGGVLRALADLVGYADVMGYRRALKQWLKREQFEVNCPVCRSPQITPDS